MYGAGQIYNWLRRISPRAVILLYHRVTEFMNDPLSLCVLPAYFAEHMRYLRHNCAPVTLQGVVKGKIPKQAVVVTFDDAYYDIQTTVRTVIERYDIPITIFIASGYVSGDREFWWDELGRLLLNPLKTPARLELNVGSRLYDWQTETPSQRYAVYRGLQDMLISHNSETITAVLNALRTWTGDNGLKRPQFRTLTIDEVRDLANCSLVEIGAHTRSHPCLSRQSIAVQTEEITGSKRQIENWVDHPIESFAYPFGTRSSYNLDTIRIVRNAGFNCACVNMSGHFTRFDDRYQMRRQAVGNWDGEEFERCMSRQFLSHHR